MDERPLSADRVPTLTEVVELDLSAVPEAGAAQTGADPAAADAEEEVPAAAEPVPSSVPEAASEAAPETLPAAAAAPGVDTEALVAQVLAELQPRIDMLLETRLRAALAPALARVSDALLRDSHDGLATALRELVQDAVDRAVQRRADR